jgi:hypothetical protein
LEKIHARVSNSNGIDEKFCLQNVYCGSFIDCQRVISKEMSKSSNTTDYNIIFNEFQSRVNKYIFLVNDKLVLLTRYLSAILLSCDNAYNQHYAENALILFTFVQYEIDALTSGVLPLEGQEKFYKGFISNQFGSFDNKKKDKTTRLTSCCAEYLLIQVSKYVLIIFSSLHSSSLFMNVD